MASCGATRKPGPTGFADDSFAEKLSAILSSPDTFLVQPGKVRTTQDVREVYASDDYQPVWIKENYKPVKNAAKLIEELEDLQWDGGHPDLWNVTKIKALYQKLDTSKVNSVTDAIRLDTTLTRMYLAAARFLMFGDYAPRKADTLWYLPNDSVWSAPYMLVNQDNGYPSLNEYRSHWPLYQLLRNAYRTYVQLAGDSSYVNAIYNMQPGQKEEVLQTSLLYIAEKEMPWFQVVPNDTLSEDKQRICAWQYYKGLRVTGRLDSITLASFAVQPQTHIRQIRANMERLRWMKQYPADTMIVVNVPLMELFFMQNGEEKMHKRVVVGKPARQTPSLWADMTQIVINPSWGVPPTILKNDVLPGIQKSGNQYMAKKGLKAYDRDGRQVNVENINARNYRRYTYKQAPGHDNSLGYVKFNMPNKWDIYLHDTPHREDFAKRERALSSGCVRVQNPMEMAEYILYTLQNKQQYTAGRLDSMTRTKRTRWEPLKNKIPVYITYLTAYQDTTAARIRFVKDIYNRDAKLIAMMNK
jgi:murein L,D-transpeptidase YcbB/YkuD